MDSELIAIDSEAMRARGIIVLVKSNYLKNIETNTKRNAIQPPLFWLPKPAHFATSGL